MRWEKLKYMEWQSNIEITLCRERELRWIKTKSDGERYKSSLLFVDSARIFSCEKILTTNAKTKPLPLKMRWDFTRLPTNLAPFSVFLLVDTVCFHSITLVFSHHFSLAISIVDGNSFKYESRWSKKALHCHQVEHGKCVGVKMLLKIWLVLQEVLTPFVRRGNLRYAHQPWNRGSINDTL